MSVQQPLAFAWGVTPSRFSRSRLLLLARLNLEAASSLIQRLSPNLRRHGYPRGSMSPQEYRRTYRHSHALSDCHSAPQKKSISYLTYKLLSVGKATVRLVLRCGSSLVVRKARDDRAGESAAIIVASEPASPTRSSPRSRRTFNLKPTKKTRTHPGLCSHTILPLFFPKSISASIAPSTFMGIFPWRTFPTPPLLHMRSTFPRIP